MSSRPPDAPMNIGWMCFDKDDDVEGAIMTFADRHKRKPEFAFVELGLLWVGPIEKGEDGG